jgi:hypothetical protein
MNNAKTEEWIDVETVGSYRDFNDTFGGETREFVRIANPWEDNGEEVKERGVLPRVDMSAGTTDVLARSG